MTNIYVGNLSFQTKEDGLRAFFEAHGEVSSVSIITERDSGRSKGFGFVEMPDAEAAQKAIEATNGAELDGRNLRVNEARPKDDSRPRANTRSRW